MRLLHIAFCFLFVLMLINIGNLQYSQQSVLGHDDQEYEIYMLRSSVENLESSISDLQYEVDTLKRKVRNLEYEH